MLGFTRGIQPNLQLIAVRSEQGFNEMPIDFFMATDGVHVRQSFDSPTVYLDHWAIRMFSDEPSLQDRFVNALMSRCGTLLLSNTSLVEFARATDARHCRDAEKFLERLLPNIFLATSS